MCDKAVVGCGACTSGQARVRKIVVLVGLVASLAACGSLGDGARNERYRMSSRAMEPTISAGSTDAVFQTEFQPITLPAGELYLLGDYREAANDSSKNGPVPVENVIGVVKL